jgi:hypothetical protein
MELTPPGRQVNHHPQYSIRYSEKLSKEDTLTILKDLERLGCV